MDKIHSTKNIAFASIMLLLKTSSLSQKNV